MWRAVAIFRILTLGYAAVLIIRNYHSYAHPAAGFAALAVMAAWTVVTVAAYARPRGRTPWLISADVAVAALLILSTRLIDTTSHINAGAPTTPVSWVAASVLACAVAGGPVSGLAGAVVIAAADLAEREALPQSTFNGTVLLADEPGRALAAAAGAALDNVRRHAGADAGAWVLIEDDGAAVTVSIRDDGRGFAERRLAEAAAAGRLGVAQSIVGRLRDVGGKACLTSSPGQGTEVELRVPRG